LPAAEPPHASQAEAREERKEHKQGVVYIGYTAARDREDAVVVIVVIIIAVKVPLARAYHLPRVLRKLYNPQSGFTKTELAVLHHGKVLAILADVNDSQQVKRAFDRTVEEFGRLDILVNNAAVTQIKAVDLLSDQDIDLIIDTNLKGYVKCAREAVKIMKASGTGGSLLFVLINTIIS